MQVLLTHDHFEATHLVEVINEMLTLGAPIIRVFYVDEDVYQAIEGCHRLRAAAALGITPEFEELDPDTLRSEVEGLDYDDGTDPAESTIETIGDISNIQLSFNAEI